MLAAIFRHPFQNRLPSPKGEADFYSGFPLCIGSPLGELAPQVTEGYFRENLHTKQKTLRKNPSTAYGGSPPLKGRLGLFRLSFVVL